MSKLQITYRRINHWTVSICYVVQNIIGRCLTGETQKTPTNAYNEGNRQYFFCSKLPLRIAEISSSTTAHQAEITSFNLRDVLIYRSILASMESSFFFRIGLYYRSKNIIYELIIRDSWKDTLTPTKPFNGL